MEIVRNIQVSQKPEDSDYNQEDAPEFCVGTCRRSLCGMLWSNIRRIHRDDEHCDKIQNDTRTAEEGEKHPCNSHKGDIHSKELRQATAHAINHSLGARFIEPFGSHGRILPGQVSVVSLLYDTRRKARCYTRHRWGERREKRRWREQEITMTTLP